MAYQPVSILRILAWGRQVGAAIPDPRSHYVLFEYDPDWIRDGIELAPMLMPVDEIMPVHQFREGRIDTFYGLPPLLADAIPDRFGNALINARLAREGVPSTAVGPLDRLAYVGHRAMGALTFEPDTGPRADEPTMLELSTLVSAARSLLEGNLGAADTATDSLAGLLRVGVSAGGARPKAVIAWDPATGEMRAGNLPVPERFEQWLIKFDGVDGESLVDPAGFGRIEYGYSLMARAAGIDMAPSRLLEEGGRAHFMTRRFDRPAGSPRLHMQSLCALAGLDFNLVDTHDYASLLLAIDALGLDEDARAQAFRRIVFNVVASNNDDHTKNHSFLMDESGAWRLAPAYDLTYSYSPHSEWVARHLMSVEGRFEEITRADLLRFADRFAVPAAAAIVTEVQEVVAEWASFARTAGVDPTWRSAIAERLADVAL